MPVSVPEDKFGVTGPFCLFFPAHRLTLLTVSLLISLTDVRIGGGVGAVGSRASALERIVEVLCGRWQSEVLGL